MKSINLLLLLLFFPGQIQGSTEMFLPTVKELTISFPEDILPKSYTVSWLDHLMMTIATYYSDGKTKVEQEGEVKISGKTSVTIESPQTSDSLVYFAKVIGDGIQMLKYFITFQGSPGELKVNVVSNFPFNITITCSKEDVEINGTFTCKNNTCHQEGGDTKSWASLRLYLLNSTIICSHSNQSSETQNQTTTQPISTPEVPTEQNVSDPRGHVLYGVLGGLLLLLGIACCAWYILKKRNCGREKSRSETSPYLPLQTFQHHLGNKVFPSQDDQIELSEVCGSPSGTSAWSGKSLQGDDEEEP